MADDLTLLGLATRPSSDVEVGMTRRANMPAALSQKDGKPSALALSTALISIWTAARRSARPGISRGVCARAHRSRPGTEPQMSEPRMGPGTSLGMGKCVREDTWKSLLAQ